MASGRLVITADSEQVIRTLRIIAKHATACADELEAARDTRTVEITSMSDAKPVYLDVRQPSQPEDARPPGY